MIGAGKGYSNLVLAQYADGPTLTAAARASALQAGLQLPIPGGFWKIGKALRLMAHGRISCGGGGTTGTARFDLGLGGTAVADTLAMPLNATAKTTEPWWLMMLMTVRAIGTSANMILGGYWLSEAALATAEYATGPGPGGFTFPFNTAPVVGANFNSTIDNALDFSFTQTQATGSMTVHQLILEELN